MPGLYTNIYDHKYLPTSQLNCKHNNHTWPSLFVYGPTEKLTECLYLLRTGSRIRIGKDAGYLVASFANSCGVNLNRVTRVCSDVLTDTEVFLQ